jgi:hypothetical protein
MKKNPITSSMKKTTRRLIRLAILICATSLSLTACTLTLPSKGTYTIQPLGRFDLHFGSLQNGHYCSTTNTPTGSCPLCGNNIGK